MWFFRQFFFFHQRELTDWLDVVSKRLKFLPILGSVHGSDLLNAYGGGEMADHLIRFVTNLDPNAPPGGDKGTMLNWPLTNDMLTNPIW